MNIAKMVASVLLMLATAATFAADANFSGTWVIDLRTAEERKGNVECGTATFVLFQTGDKLTGDHTFATPGCGRLNEGGEGTVSGIVVGNAAVLVVTSGRNGAMVLGKATLKNSALVWETFKELSSSDPVGDSPLILGNGVLQRAQGK